MGKYTPSLQINPERRPAVLGAVVLGNAHIVQAFRFHGGGGAVAGEYGVIAGEGQEAAAQFVYLRGGTVSAGGRTHQARCQHIAGKEQFVNPVNGGIG